MKKITSLLVLLLAGIALYGEGIVGTWEGSFKAPTPDGGETTLRLVFHIAETDDGYVTAGDSPDQGQYGFATTSTTYADEE